MNKCKVCGQYKNYTILGGEDNNLTGHCSKCEVGYTFKQEICGKKFKIAGSGRHKIRSSDSSRASSSGRATDIQRAGGSNPPLSIFARIKSFLGIRELTDKEKDEKRLIELMNKN